ncbi:MAG: PilN domain-containing protein [Pseudomonadota bacterium]
MTALRIPFGQTWLPRFKSGVTSAFGWWCQHMASLWPVSALLTDPEPKTTTVQLSADQGVEQSLTHWDGVLPVALAETSDGALQALRGLSGNAITVLLDPAQTYFCQATFPTAALKAGSEAVAYHLQTASPLPLDQIYYDTQSQGDGDVALVHIAITRRATVDEIVRFFETHGLPLERIAATKPNAEDDDLSFSFYQRVSFGQGLFSAKTGLALLASLFLLPFLAALLLWSYGAFKAASLDAALAADRQTYAKDIALTRQFDTLNAIAADLETAAPPAQLANTIAELAAAVPQETWLDRVSFDGRQIQFQGYSSNPNAVAGSLRGLSAITNVRLDRVTATDGDRLAPMFSMSANWADCSKDDLC